MNIFATETPNGVLPLSDLDTIQSEAFNAIVLTNENKTFVKNLLLDAVEIAVNNIINVNTSSNENGAVYNRYIYIDENYNIELRYFDKTKYVYDPLHPNAIASGKHKGYVVYPDVDLESLADEITFLLNFLKENDLSQLIFLHCKKKH